jgi:hypothetical protein
MLALTVGLAADAAAAPRAKLSRDLADAAEAGVARGVILQADIIVNAVDHAWGPDAYDLQNVLTHELGHALGLPHLEAAHATMFARIRPGEPEKRVARAKAEGERKDNHGACVSAVAKSTPAAGADANAHGKLVSATAKSDCGKTANGNSAEAKKKAAEKKAERAKR